MRSLLFVFIALSLAACGRLEQVGKAPDFNTVEGSDEFFAMSSPPLPEDALRRTDAQEASLWSGNRGSLLGDRRAATRGAPAAPARGRRRRSGTSRASL